MQHIRDNRGNDPGMDSSIDRIPCAACQQPLRRDEATTHRGEPVHPTCVAARASRPLVRGDRHE